MFSPCGNNTKVLCVASTVHSDNSHYKVKRRLKTSTGDMEIMIDILIQHTLILSKWSRSFSTLPDLQLLEDIFCQCIDIAGTNKYILHVERTNYDHKTFNY